MNKTQIIDAMAAKTGMSKKDCEKAYAALVETVGEALAAGNKVQAFGFGTFSVRERAAREGRNPKTGAAIKIAASKSIGFSASKALKDVIAK